MPAREQYSGTGQRLYAKQSFRLPDHYIARDYLSIPATSAPSERAFSLAGNLISKKRGRIASRNVRYVLCLRSWGFLVDDDDEDEIIIDENGRIIEPVDDVVPVPEVVDLEEE